MSLEQEKPLFEAIKWWQTYINDLDPSWKLKANRLCTLWKSDKRTMHKLPFEFVINRHEDILKYIPVENITNFNTWVFNTAFILCYYYYLFPKLQAKRSASDDADTANTLYS